MARKMKSRFAWQELIVHGRSFQRAIVLWHFVLEVGVKNEVTFVLFCCGSLVGVPGTLLKHTPWTIVL